MGRLNLGPSFGAGGMADSLESLMMQRYREQSLAAQILEAASRQKAEQQRMAQQQQQFEASQKQAASADRHRRNIAGVADMESQYRLRKEAEQDNYQADYLASVEPTSPEGRAGRYHQAFKTNPPAATVAAPRPSLADIEEEAAARARGTASVKPPAWQLSESQRFNMQERLAKAWDSATKPQRELDRQVQMMDAGLDEYAVSPNAASQAVLVTFQKILDPTSVVRESEYARSSAGLSALGRIRGAMERIQRGGAGMTESDLKAVAQVAREFSQGYRQYTAGTRRRLEATAKKYDIDPELVFYDFEKGPEQGEQPAAVTDPKDPMGIRR